MLEGYRKGFLETNKKTNYINCKTNLYYNGPLQIILGLPKNLPPLRVSNLCAPSKMYTEFCLHQNQGLQNISLKLQPKRASKIDRRLQLQASTYLHLSNAPRAFTYEINAKNSEIESTQKHGGKGNKKTAIILTGRSRRREGGAGHVLPPCRSQADSHRREEGAGNVLPPCRSQADSHRSLAHVAPTPRPSLVPASIVPLPIE